MTYPGIWLRYPVFARGPRANTAPRPHTSNNTENTRSCIYYPIHSCILTCVRKRGWRIVMWYVLLGSCEVLGCWLVWSLTSLCHSNGHIETMPARKFNPFTALTRIRSQFLRTQWSTSNQQRVDMTTPPTAQPSRMAVRYWACLDIQVCVDGCQWAVFS